MKQILAILTILTFISCNKRRDTYLITGKVEGVPDSAIIDLYAQSYSMGKRIATDTIINGQFEFSDTLETRPSKMTLRMRDWKNFFGGCNLWVDHEVIKVTGKGKYLSSWNVNSNVQEQQALNQLTRSTKELAVKCDSLYMVMMNNRGDKDLFQKTRKMVDSIQQIRQKTEFDIVEKNPNSQSALEMLYRIAKFDTTIDKNRIKQAYNKLNAEYQNTLYGEGILSILEETKAPEIGDKMVDFVAHDTEGKEHSLNGFKGKYILLDFWALACGPCIKAIPETRKLHANNNELLTVIGVNMVTNEDEWRETSKKDSITWVNLSDGKGTFAGISAKYGVKGFPTYILINPDGVIVDRWMGYWPGSFKEKLSKHIDDLKI